MTDQAHLFRGPIQKLKRRRLIQVGGGTLWSDSRGTIEVIAADGSSCLVQKCLLVPNLGISLISARRLCKEGIVGIHDSKNLYFKKLENSITFKNDNKTFLHAQQKNGLYTHKSISNQIHDSAFPTFKNAVSDAKDLPVGNYSCSSHSNDIDDVTDDIIDESKDDSVSKSRRRRYRLTHRRFGHYGSQALRY